MQDEVKKKTVNRLKRIEGQVRGLGRMVEEEVYCVDIITQTQAVKQSLSSLEDVLLENHLATCATDQMKGNQERKAIDEMMKVYKLAKKK